MAFVLSLAGCAVALAGPEGRIHVVDGDTIDVGGERVRLYGIDAPEAGQTCKTGEGVVWECGAEVTRQVRDAYEGRRARCETRDVDRYGRAVATCTVEGQDLARLLVQQGLAFAYRRYSMDYDLDEKGAAVAGRGLWSSEVERPADYRARREADEAPRGGTSVGGWLRGLFRTGCTIKGNVSATGERVYHVPGQEHYAQTRISRGSGERWFCSEQEARAAGWRRAAN